MHEIAAIIFLLLLCDRKFARKSPHIVETVSARDIDITLPLPDLHSAEAPLLKCPVVSCDSSATSPSASCPAHASDSDDSHGDSEFALFGGSSAVSISCDGLDFAFELEVFILFSNFMGKFAAFLNSGLSKHDRVKKTPESRAFQSRTLEEPSVREADISMKRFTSSTKESEVKKTPSKHEKSASAKLVSERHPKEVEVEKLLDALGIMDIKAPKKSGAKVSLSSSRAKLDPTRSKHHYKGSK